jgi:hypothetical protein
VKKTGAAGYAWFGEAAPAYEAFHFGETPPCICFVAREKLRWLVYAFVYGGRGTYCCC